VVTKPDVSEQDQSRTVSDPLKDKPDLPQPFYNSYGKKVLEYISPSEIMLDLPFILTRDKRLSINLPYLKIEQKLSGDDINAIKLLRFEVSDGIIRLYVQELDSKKSYTLEWNMDVISNGFWLWQLADMETIIRLSTSTK
jgi:hypothetical protein